MQDLTLEVAGLYTHPNPLSSVPKGGLSVAENIVIDRENLAESRRGFVQYATLPDPHKAFNFDDTIIVHSDDLFVIDNGSGTFTNVNTTSYTASLEGPTTNLLAQSIQANGNLYLTTDKGVIKLDSSTGTLARAGVPRALDLSATAANVAGGFLANNSAVAYRVVWGTLDANENLLLGTPSPRAEVNNNSGNVQQVTLNFSVPPDCQFTSYFWQLYRSFPSVAADVPGDDQLQLIAQEPYVSGDNVTYVDNRPDSLMGAALYTNDLQEGITMANDRPPWATDICSFNDMTFFANTKLAHRMILTMDANAVAGYALNVDGIVYTANTSFAIGADVPTTVKNLTVAINREANNDNVRAVWVIGGSFLIERVDYGDAFTANTSNTGWFRETMPVTSINDAALNKVFISKAGRPEAVPELSSLTVGRADKAILRILAIRDCVFVLKEDGIWRITGTDPSNLVVEAHDTTYQCVGPETAVRLDNTVVACSTKGVIAISVGGVTPLSRPIEKDILKHMAQPNFLGLAWAAAYTSDRKYLLGLPSDAVSTTADLLYVFNTFTQSWTTWPLALAHAVVGEGDDKLYVIRSTDNTVLKERKDFLITDYADDEFAVTITDSDEYEITLADASDAVVGQSIKQNSAVAKITDISANVVTVDTIQTWANSAATLYDPIECKLRWLEQHCGNPSVIKHFTEITYLFEAAKFRTVSVGFASNFVPAFLRNNLVARSAAAWGNFPWGGQPWGSSLGGKQGMRTYFPRPMSRALWVVLEVALATAFNTFGLAGACISFEPTSTRFK